LKKQQIPFGDDNKKKPVRPDAGKGNRNRHLAGIFRHQGFIKA